MNFIISIHHSGLKDFIEIIIRTILNLIKMLTTIKINRQETATNTITTNKELKKRIINEIQQNNKQEK